MQIDETPPRAVAGLLLAGWIVLLGVVIGIGWLLVHPLNSSVGTFDDKVARWFAEGRTPTLNTLADVGTLLGDTIVGICSDLVVAVGFAIWTRSIRPAVFVVVAAAGVYAIYLLAVTVDPRPRPPVKILDPGLVPTHSFPSGHVGTAVVLYGCVVVLTWTYARAARWWVTPLLVLPLVVLVARLYQGAHHLSDVVTSLVFAAVWVGTVSIVLRSGRTDSR